MLKVEHIDAYTVLLLTRSRSGQMKCAVGPHADLRQIFMWMRKYAHVRCMIALQISVHHRATLNLEAAKFSVTCMVVRIRMPTVKNVHYLFAH